MYHCCIHVLCLHSFSASIPAVHNILPFWLAKKVFALAKYLWSLYWQWWHSTSTKSETDIATEEKSHETSAKTSENTTEGVNRNVDEHKSGSGSDVESSKEAEDGASGGDGDGEETKIRRRRGKWVPEELRASAKREEDKPYVPPAYYCEDEELNSDEDSESSSDVDEPSQLQIQHTSSSHAQSSLLQEMGSNSTEAKTECIKQDSTMDDVQEMDGKSVEDVCVLSVADKRIDVEDKEDCEATDTSSKGGTSVVMVSNSKDGKTSSSWSRYQQKQLEWALVQYPKFAMDRWDNIAKAVPGKNKVCTYLSSQVQYYY